MAVFVLPDQEGIATGGGQFFFHLALLVELVRHLHEGEAPVFAVGCDKRHQRRVFENIATAAVEVFGDEVSLFCPCVIQSGFFFQVHDEDVDLPTPGVCVFAQAFDLPDGICKVVIDVVAVVGEGGGFSVVEEVYDQLAKLLFVKSVF